MESFRGYSPQLPEFLARLQLDNTTANQAANAAQYRRLLTEPTTALYEALLPTVTRLCPALDCKPSRCVSSPYTDRRFSRDKPLKEYIYLRFRLLNRAEDVTGFYFDLGMTHYGFGLKRYHQTAEGMARLRERLTEKLPTVERVLEPLVRAGFTFPEEAFRRDHYPTLADGAAKQLLNRRFFCVEKTGPTDPAAFDPALADQIAAGFALLAPLLEWL